ncbi:electron transport complex subunit RsxE [Acetanaerobacterium elongatum]|uniref:Ion-translocating oxidoreductase complex subunit E n=1 Tax=Acetanaerobacterium elongatum TaxID=258515 RepID=A0A1G9XC18_9FIRM|nr:electron transport complex subunit E [Acetanaerobacterium elongatum]SDM94300.1 electron transport complex protein RnfE [Acetanaerobacterium elongatum]
MKQSKSLGVLLNGIIKENPTLVLVLGTCPTLATTTSVSTGVGMGIAAMAVLIGSNLVISLIKGIVPKKVRIPAYVMVIAGFVTIVSMLLKAYAPDLNNALGIFLPLIVVNCIILARAEAFASKNSPWLSVMDGIGMGLGFTLALFLIGSVRELLGAGTWFGLQIIPKGVTPMAIFAQAPGGFFVFGVVMAAVGAILKKVGRKPVQNPCENCPSHALCGAAGECPSEVKEEK